jgi:streptogramin lyase
MSVRGFRRWLVAPGTVAVVAASALMACGGGDQTAGDGGPIEVRDVGFMTPESVIADTVADVYLVSNINGTPLDKDDNGFISRLNPDGTVEQLKWIDGENPNLFLHAPKGLAIRGDTLFVADINCIRMFHRTTGEAYDGECIEGATFLNDLAVGPEGSIFVTDMGMRAGAAGFEPSGTDGVFRYPFQAGLAGATVARSADLGHPNGVAVSSRGIFVVTFGSGEVLNFSPTGEKRVLLGREGWQLDGIVFTNDGSFYFSNWSDSSVYRVDAGGRIAKAIEGVPNPADIGYDPKRNRLLVPLFMSNAVVFHDLGSN